LGLGRFLKSPRGCKSHDGGFTLRTIKRKFLVGEVVYHISI
jgi:hypothetical protein